MFGPLEDTMHDAENIQEPAEINAVVLKAYARVADAWGLTLREAAGVADTSESTWKRAKKLGFAGELTKDVLRDAGCGDDSEDQADAFRSGHGDQVDPP
jgi:hypothetical protein